MNVSEAGTIDIPAVPPLKTHNPVNHALDRRTPIPYPTAR